MVNKHDSDSKVISFRVNKPAYDRLDLRARKKGAKLGTYMKDFVIRDLFRTKDDANG